MNTDLRTVWAAAFPESPPVRHLLRRTYPARWVRVHSLPDARRFPTGLAEEEELLRRHDRVANRIVTNGGECALVLAYGNGYHGEDEPDSIRSFDPKVAEGWCETWLARPWFADDLENMTLAIARFTYAPGILTPLILDVAHGRTAPLLIFSLTSGRIYSPYDGGADLFLENSGVRDALQGEFGDWLSHRADGL